MARRLASAGPMSSKPAASTSTSFEKLAVATARRFLSARAISLPIAANAHPACGRSRCAVERYFETIARKHLRCGFPWAALDSDSLVEARAAAQASPTSCSFESK